MSEWTLADLTDVTPVGEDTYRDDDEDEEDKFSMMVKTSLKKFSMKVKTS